MNTARWSVPTTATLSPPRDKSLATKLHALRRLQTLSQVMDSSLTIPVLGTRVGWDSIVGLIPGVGDVATTAISGYIVYQAAQIGVRKRTLARMCANIAIDTAVGSIPLLGDAFDVVWKANQKNIRLLEKDLLRNHHISEE